MVELRTVVRISVVGTVSVLLAQAVALSAPAIEVGRYGVIEVTFKGPHFTASDRPAVEVELWTLWRHESGGPTYKVYGFWDGDGKGGTAGNVFKVRFCPTHLGTWTLVKTVSNRPELKGQHQGYRVVCVESSHPGFWEPDAAVGGRWYKRSDGSHPYIVGNTMYSFLSEYDDKGSTGTHIADDIQANARYFKKVRFAVTADRYPHPTDKPFLDDSGRGTDDGDFSSRPNPAWFHKRLDVAVQRAYECDLIADLILCGPDTQDSRSVLRAGASGGDCTAFLRYIAARYGSYPNVWICLANEFDIKKPRYTAAQIVHFGRILRCFLPYPTPMSVHARPRDWSPSLNVEPAWNDHVTLQKKIKTMPVAADFVARNYKIGGADKPVIDDELAYEGKGDGWSEADVIEAHLGAFLGGGYGTTGHKPARKRGHYFFGNFKASEHKSADNLQWFRRLVDRRITFWRMAPLEPAQDGRLGPFENVHPDFRALAWPGHEYVLGTNRPWTAIRVSPGPGRWELWCYDLLAKRRRLVAGGISGSVSFDAPRSRAALFHLKKTGD